MGIQFPKKKWKVNAIYCMFIGDQNNVKKKEHSSEKTFKGTLNKSFLNFFIACK